MEIQQAMKKCYVIIIAKAFPTSHPRRGVPTNFKEQIIDRIKIHTIRGNYKLWKERIDKVNEGEAYLSIREWTGKPYNSKQREIFQLHNDVHPIGYQRVRIYRQDEIFTYLYADGFMAPVKLEHVAKNDGLDVEDFKRWFFPKGVKGPQYYDGIIIHFTMSKYKTVKP